MKRFAVIAIVAILAITASASAEVVNLINHERTSQHIPAVRRDSRLDSAAFRHSQDMAQNGFCGHTGSDGSTPGQRARDAGYDWRGIGEIVACGQHSPAAAVNAWMNSPGHRAIIMDSRYVDIGCAEVNRMWTCKFAWNGGHVPPPPPPPTPTPRPPTPTPVPPTPVPPTPVPPTPTPIPPTPVPPTPTPVPPTPTPTPTVTPVPPSPTPTPTEEPEEPFPPTPTPDPQPDPMDPLRCTVQLLFVFVCLVVMMIVFGLD